MWVVPTGHASALMAVFGAGVLASLSPCVYPLLPITLGFLGSQAPHRRWAPIVIYSVGQMLAFAGLGAFAVLAGESLGFTSETPWVCVLTGATLLAAGVFSWLERLPAFVSRGAQLLGKFSGAGAWSGAFALGAGSALVASPCTSPLLAGVLALMAGQATLGWGVVLMLSYALGFSSLFLLLGLGLLSLQRLPRAGQWMRILQKAGALSLIGAGFYFIGKAI